VASQTFVPPAPLPIDNGYARNIRINRSNTRLGAENYTRAGAAQSPELKTKLTENAANYRDLALQFDDPEQWHANILQSATAKPKQR
jgi:hypothetical protein